jgi:TatD DNase family protein
MLIDTHCHLDQVDDPDGVIAVARAAGVGRIVAVSQDLGSMQAVLELRDRHPETVVAGLGIHPQTIPYLADDEVGEAFAFLERHLGEADLLGEVGLDYKHATTDAEKTRQAEWLERQLELAAHHRKPANLHSRRALRQVMNHAVDFQQRTGLAAQLHWFTQSSKLVRATNAAGVYVSAGPTTLFADDARAVAAQIDDDLLLLETDCPVPYRGDSARPDWVVRVLECLAGARGVEPGELEAQVEQNFVRFLAGAPPVRTR